MSPPDPFRRPHFLPEIYTASTVVVTSPPTAAPISNLPHYLFANMSTPTLATGSTTSTLLTPDVSASTSEIRISVAMQGSRRSSIALEEEPLCHPDIERPLRRLGGSVFRGRRNDLSLADTTPRLRVCNPDAGADSDASRDVSLIHEMRSDQQVSGHSLRASPPHDTPDLDCDTYDAPEGAKQTKKHRSRLSYRAPRSAPMVRDSQAAELFEIAKFQARNLAQLRLEGQIAPVPEGVADHVTIMQPFPRLEVGERLPATAANYPHGVVGQPFNAYPRVNRISVRLDQEGYPIRRSVSLSDRLMRSILNPKQRVVGKAIKSPIAPKYTRKTEVRTPPPPYPGTGAFLALGDVAVDFGDRYGPVASAKMPMSPSSPESLPSSPDVARSPRFDAIGRVVPYPMMAVPSFSAESLSPPASSYGVCPEMSRATTATTVSLDVDSRESVVVSGSVLTLGEREADQRLSAIPAHVKIQILPASPEKSGLASPIRVAERPRHTPMVRQPTRRPDPDHLSPPLPSPRHPPRTVAPITRPPFLPPETDEDMSAYDMPPIPVSMVMPILRKQKSTPLLRRMFNSVTALTSPRQPPEVSIRGKISHPMSLQSERATETPRVAQTEERPVPSSELIEEALSMSKIRPDSEIEAIRTELAENAPTAGRLGLPIPYHLLDAPAFSPILPMDCRTAESSSPDDALREYAAKQRSPQASRPSSPTRPGTVLSRASDALRGFTGFSPRSLPLCDESEGAASPLESDRDSIEPKTHRPRAVAGSTDLFKQLQALKKEPKQ